MREPGRSKTGLAVLALAFLAVLGVGAGIVGLSGSASQFVSPASSSLAQARQLLDEGKIEAARKIFEDVFRKDPKNVEAVRGLAFCARDDGDDETALGYLHKLTTLASKDRAAWRQLALCANRLGRDMEALSASQTALALAPEGDRGMSDLIARLVTKKSLLEGGVSGDQLPGEGLPGKGKQGAGIDPPGDIRLPEPPDPRKHLPGPGRDR